MGLGFVVHSQYFQHKSSPYHRDLSRSTRRTFSWGKTHHHRPQPVPGFLLNMCHESSLQKKKNIRFMDLSDTPGDGFFEEVFVFLTVFWGLGSPEQLFQVLPERYEKAQVSLVQTKACWRVEWNQDIFETVWNQESFQNNLRLGSSGLVIIPPILAPAAQGGKVNHSKAMQLFWTRDLSLSSSAPFNGHHGKRNGNPT